MNKILRYGNRKADPVYLKFDTPEQQEKAWKALFKILDTEWEVYAELLEEPEGVAPLCNHKCHAHQPEAPHYLQNREREYRRLIGQRAWYLLAKQGDVKAIERLCRARKGFEYEEWEILTIS